MRQIKEEAQADSSGHPVGRQNPRIQGLRGFAVALIFLEHLGGRIERITGADSPVIRLCWTMMSGHVGSSLFLLITGYVIYLRCRDDAGFSWRHFIRARALRILPLFWIVLVGYAAIDLLTGFRGKVPADPWAAAAVILQNATLLAPFGKVPILLSVSWTLSYVAIGYATIPLLARWFAGRRFTLRARLLAISVYAAVWVAAPLLWSRLYPNGVNLALGMIICEAGRAGLFARVRTWIADAAAVIAVTASVMLIPNLGMIAGPVLRRPLGMLTTALPLSLLLAGRIGASGWLNRALVCGPARWLGQISYSAYFAHGAALLLLQELLVLYRPFLAGQVPDGVLLAGEFTAGFALCVLAAACLHYGIEKPVTRLLRPAAKVTSLEVSSDAEQRSRAAVA